MGFIQICLWLLVWLSLTEGKRSPYRDQATIRIFKEAPRGTLVYSVSVSSLVDVTQHRLFRLSHSGPDQNKFRLSEDNSLRVEQHPYLSGEIGQMFRVTIQARSVGMSDTLLAELRLTIIVSETNRFEPTFNDMSQIEVYKYIPPGTIIGQITTTDKDAEPYNRETKYIIKTFQEHSFPFTIDPQSGVLKTAANLENSPPTYSLRVSAVNTGSPQLQKTASFSIIIRDLAAPIHLKVQVYNATYSEACWQAPPKIGVRKYELWLKKGLKKNPRITRRIVKPQDGKKQCATFEADLHIDYSLTVRVMNGATLGMAADVDFLIENGRCGKESCPKGTCVFTSQGGSCMCNKNGVQVKCSGGNDNSYVSTPCEHDKDCPVAEQPHCNCENSYNVQSCRAVCDNLRTSCANGGSPEFDVFGRIKCSCVKGYYGPKCELFDPCSASLCKNEATCMNFSNTEYNCSCVLGYYGDHCEFLNPCIRNPCRNGGHCRNVSSTDYTCTCYYGFYSKNCDRYDPCFSSPCQNNGQCRNISDSTFTCKCKQGFLGGMCESYQPCNKDPCLYGGFCNSVDGHFFCQCPYARFGRKCQHINLCDHLQPCGTHAVACHNMTDTQYKCLCEPGWSGQNCSNYDPCFGNPCQHGGQCEQTSDMSYVCQCLKGHYGENCERTNLCSNSPCKNDAVCKNVSSHEYHCVCPEGFYGNDCESFNPCMSAKCLNEGKCQNISSTTYQCNCPQAYFGDICQHFNSCYENPCEHGDCHVDKDGFYSCNCRPGYHGINCQIYDPCLRSPCLNDAKCIANKDDTYTCQCKDRYYGDNCDHYDACYSNPCSNGRCMNLPEGSYHCTCPPGRYGLQCLSRNPCANKPCKNNATCIHFEGPEYRCKCQSGYYGIHCEKFNPCSSHPCQHHGSCIHLGEDDFRCTCTVGHQGAFCEEDVPCDISLGKICYNNGDCITLNSGSKTCECPAGYHGYRCQGFDPCLSEDTCNHGGVCKGLDNGKYMCECLDGFFGEKCEYHSSCYKDNFCHNHATCVQSNEGPVCYCPPGYKGVRCDEDIDECLSSPCEYVGQCHNLPGSFVCDSPEACLTHTTIEARGTYIWPQSRHGNTISIECTKSPGKYAKRMCYLKEDNSVEWGEPDTTECDLRVENASQAILALKPFKAEGIFDNVRQLKQAKELLNVVLKFSIDNTQEAITVSDEVMTVIDNVMSAPVDVIKQSKVAKSILEILDEFMSSVKWMNKTVSFERKNFEIYAKQNSWIEHEAGLTYIPKGNPKARIFLPAEVFTKDPSNERVKFVYFKTSKLFVPAEGKPVEGTVTEILSASVGKAQIINLQDCISFQLPNSMSPRHAKCVYWDEKGEFWATAGLSKMSHTGFTTSCCSSHLTFFAIAANPESAMITMSEEHFYMSLTSSGGTACALLGIIVVFITYVVFRHLNIQAFGHVVVQLSLSLVIMNITVLISWNRHQVYNDDLCLSVGLLSHFFIMSSLLWAVVLGKCVYTTLKQNIYLGNKSFIIKHCIFAYGIPLSCVATAGGLRKHLYLEDLDTCQLTTTNRYIYCTTYLTPCWLAVLGMIIATVFIVRAKCCFPDDHTSQEKPTLNFWQVYGSVCIMFLLTLSWIFKYTASITKKSDYTVYFGCAYFVTNGLVGLSMCLFFFFMKAEACKSWTRCNVGKRPLPSTASSTNNSSTSRNKSNSGRYALVQDNGARDDTNSKKVRSPVYHRHKIIHQTSRDDCTVPEGDYVGISSAAEQVNINGGVRNKSNTQFTHLHRDIGDTTARSSRV